MLSRAGLEALDRGLASLARLEGAWRLRLGQCLEALGHPDFCGSKGYAELGFSSLAAYVRERAERSTRWAEAARCMARRLEALPHIRIALASGIISWSMAEPVARIATPSDETEWLARAERMTVRQMQELVKAELGRRRSANTGEGEPWNARDATREDALEMVTLRLKVDQEDAWLLRATQTLMERGLDTVGSDEQAGALLGESMSTLMNCLPDGAIDWCALSEEIPAWRDPREAAYRQMRGEWQAEAEQRCETRITRGIAEQPAAGVDDELAHAAALGAVTLQGLPPGALDGAVREVARRLAAQDLELARGLLLLHEADGWRRLGYASERQYARERLGISVSLIFARRSLARKLSKLPAIAGALERGGLGVEAAVLISSVATPATEAEWLDRGKRRTLKHLTEEVEAAGMAKRVSGGTHCPPPTDREIEAFQELERAVVSGKVLSCESVDLGAATEPARVAWHRMLGSLARWLEGGLQKSAALGRRTPATRSAGRVEVCLRMSRANYALWHTFELAVRRVLRIPMSFLRFLCLVLWKEEQHVIGAATSVLIRDRARCSSPVCCRHDVQEHHVRFRSQGGTDADENLIDLCFWCHIPGIHERRLTATGVAGKVRWVVGRAALFIVEGRERKAA